MTRAKKVTKSIRIDKEVCEAISKMAQEEDRNFSNMIEHILKKYLKQQP